MALRKSFRETYKNKAHFDILHFRFAKINSELSRNKLLQTTELQKRMLDMLSPIETQTVYYKRTIKLINRKRK